VIRRIVLCLALGWLLAAAPALADDIAWNLGDPGSVGPTGWMAGPGAARQEVKGGAWSIDFQGADKHANYLVSPPLTVDADDHDFLEIELASSQPYTKGLIFWINDQMHGFNPEIRVPFNHAGSGRFHTYVIDLKKHPWWTGYAKQLIIFPFYSEDGQVRIRRIAFRSGTPWLQLLAAWQEYFSIETTPFPPNLAEVFMINGPTINFRPVNHYLYWGLLGLAGLLALAAPLLIWGFKLNPWAAAKGAFVILWLALLAGYGLVEIKQLSDHYKYLSADLQTLAGKSLEQKRSAITGGDFYEFVDFCVKALPTGASWEACFSNTVPNAFAGDWLTSKANFYLYPAVVAPDGQYKLVYKDGIKKFVQRPGHHYQVFARFKPDQFIIKED